MSNPSKGLTAESFDELMRRLYAGGSPVHGPRAEDDVWVLAHFLNKLIQMIDDNDEDASGYLYDALRSFISA